VLRGKVTYLYKKGEEYLPGEEKFKFAIAPQTVQTLSPSTGDSAVANRSLVWIFFAAFGGGLLALLTPCVYSMIPVTVSFFTKRSKTNIAWILDHIDLWACSIEQSCNELDRQPILFRIVYCIWYLLPWRI
jgi:hypothetical protein